MKATEELGMGQRGLALYMERRMAESARSRENFSYRIIAIIEKAERTNVLDIEKKFAT